MCFNHRPNLDESLLFVTIPFTSPALAVIAGYTGGLRDINGSGALLRARNMLFQHLLQSFLYIAIHTLLKPLSFKFFGQPLYKSNNVELSAAYFWEVLVVNPIVLPFCFLQDLLLCTIILVR